MVFEPKWLWASSWTRAWRAPTGTSPVRVLLHPRPVVGAELAGGQRGADIGRGSIEELELEFAGVGLVLARRPHGDIEGGAGIELGGGEALGEEVDRLLQDRRVGAAGRAEIEAAAVGRCDRALSGAGVPGAGGCPAGSVASLGARVGERHCDAAERDVDVAELDQRAGAGSATGGPGADREHIQTVAVDHGGAVGTGADRDPGAS